jgi:septum formation protein
VRPADVDESVRPGEAADAYTERLAREKAAAVAARLAPEDDAVVVAADTTVVIDGELLGKPVDAADARRTVRRLAGRTHAVYTGVAVVRDGRAAAGVERVLVTFRALDDAEIAAYVATGEPMDKAGSYGIQGYGATIVERIEGDYFAVMGLPLVRLVALLRAVGVVYDFGGVHVPGR